MRDDPSMTGVAHGPPRRVIRVFGNWFRRQASAPVARTISPRWPRCTTRMVLILFRSFHNPRGFLYRGAMKALVSRVFLNTKWPCAFSGSGRNRFRAVFHFFEFPELSHTCEVFSFLVRAVNIIDWFAGARITCLYYVKFRIRGLFTNTDRQTFVRFERTCV